ncbi:MAG: AbgT family transporter [Planctomycetota bacterium]|jgi:aminobenzoyl-glutamate transport protein
MSRIKNTLGFARFLKFVEWAGNLLPHPVTLFALLCVSIIVISGVADWFGLEVADPRPEGAKGRDASGTIRVVSLLSADGLRKIFMNVVPNFTGFAPLGTVLVALLGVGIAEGSGLIRTAVRSLILNAPARLVTFALVLGGVLSNTASELGYVVLVPLGGYIFKGLGRNPMAGMAAAFAGVSGGYSANLLIGTIDPLLAGITQEAAQLVAPEYTVHAAVNWYFMIVSTFMITVVGTFVTEKFVEPNLGPYDPAFAKNDGGDDSETFLKPLTDVERSALKWGLLTAAGVAAVLALLVVPPGAPLRDPETGAILRSPFLKGVVTAIFVFFAIPGVVYGWKTRAIRSDKDVIESMANSMRTLGLYIVIVFFAAQFITFFKWTNLGLILAVSGAQGLQSLGIEGPGIFFPVIIVCAMVNLALGSASAQWAATSPIFVPMLMLLGYSPEVVQAAYRIGDSSTNIIAPMMSYFPLILAFFSRFDRRVGVGTVISTMLPYSICFLLGWSVLFYLWVFVLGMPVGPEAPTYFGG